MRLDEILDRFTGVKPSRHGTFKAYCPVHEADGLHKPSLTITVKEGGKLLVGCWGACETVDVLEAVGLTFKDLFDVDVPEGSKIARTINDGMVTLEDRRRATVSLSAWVTQMVGPVHSPRQMDPLVAETLQQRFGIDPAGITWQRAHDLGIGYDRDEKRLIVAARTPDGRVTFIQGRDLTGTAPKQRRWDGIPNMRDDKGERRWWGTGFVGPVRGTGPVLICEGPSDSLTIAARDKYDVIAVRGAQQAPRINEQAEHLIGRDVVVCGDNDEAGEKFNHAVAKALRGTARSIKIASLKGVTQ